MKIVVAIPVYDGKLHANVISCLLTEHSMAIGLGDDLVVEFLPNCSVPAMGRNQLVQGFMDSGFDRLVFLDSDITFNPGDLIKLCYRPVDIVGGAYRFKLPMESYPVGWIPDQNELWLDKNGLLEVASLPTGFLCISRKAFELLKEKYPGREFTHMGKTMNCYFQMKFENGGLYSEDSYFCKEWRDIGGKVFMDPDIELTHWDFAPVPFKGNIGKWLKDRPDTSDRVQELMLEKLQKQNTEMLSVINQKEIENAKSCLS